MQIAVIGLGSFGSKLATTLHTLHGEVIAIDKQEDLVEAIKGHVSQAVQLDATNERSLRALGMADVDVAVVAIANEMEESIMVTTLLRQMGVTKIIARALSNLHEKVLYEVGASQVIRLEEQMAEQSAKWIIAPQILKQHTFAQGYSLIEVRAKERFIGKKVVHLNVREDYDLGIAAIQKRTPDVDEGGRSIFQTTVKSPPDPEDTISRDDILVLFGKDSAILKFTQED